LASQLIHDEFNGDYDYLANIQHSQTSSFYDKNMFLIKMTVIGVLSLVFIVLMVSLPYIAHRFKESKQRRRQQQQQQQHHQQQQRINNIDNNINHNNDTIGIISTSNTLTESSIINASSFPIDNNHFKSLKNKKSKKWCQNQNVSESILTTFIKIVLKSLFVTI
jgi:cell division protein FtsB